MALDKSELKFLLKELKKVFVTKDEFGDVDINTDELMDIFATKEDLENLDIDSLTKENTYIGSEAPEDTDLIWFDTGDAVVDEITYDNPLVSELFACVQTLQNQVNKLQEEVEYLKINGGGSSGGGTILPDDNNNNNTEEVNVIFALEDGGLFLLEDGGFLLTEETVIVNTNTQPSLSLEDGSLFLLESGGFFLLEEASNEIEESILLLENDYKLLFENGNDILLESN